MAIRDDAVKTAALMAEDPFAEEQTIVERLVAQGYTLLQAEVLVAFVPLGLGRAVIARIPAGPSIHLPKTAMIQDFKNNILLEVALKDVPEYTAARQLGEETYLQRGVQPGHLKAASERSVELNLISEALYAGVGIHGAKIAPPILLRLAEAPGFKAWYQEIESKKK